MGCIVIVDERYVLPGMRILTSDGEVVQVSTVNKEPGVEPWVRGYKVEGTGKSARLTKFRAVARSRIVKVL